MKSDWSFRILTGIAMVGVLSIQSASADVLTYSPGPYNSAPVTVQISNPPPPFPALSGSGTAGSFFMTDQTSGNTFLAWSLDVYDPLGLSGNYDFHLAQDLEYYLPTRANALGKFATNHLGSVTDATSNAAFQIAIWEILYEQILPPDISQGSFIANAGLAANALATSWLTAAANPLPNAMSVDVWVSTDLPRHETVVTFAPVPAPQSLVLLLAGLAVMGAVRSKRTHATA